MCFYLTILSYIVITFPLGWWLTVVLFKSACTYHVKIQTDTLFRSLPFFFKHQRNHNSNFNVDQIGKMTYVLIVVTTDYIGCLAPLSIWVVLCFVLFCFVFLSFFFFNLFCFVLFCFPFFLFFCFVLFCFVFLSFFLFSICFVLFVFLSFFFFKICFVLFCFPFFLFFLICFVLFCFPFFLFF